ncbi:MAG: four helix bundle protein [Xenococcaceae cyanobacterium]
MGTRARKGNRGKGYGMVQQIRKSPGSIRVNIAEVYGRRHILHYLFSITYSLFPIPCSLFPTPKSDSDKHGIYI